MKKAVLVISTSILFSVIELNGPVRAAQSSISNEKDAVSFVTQCTIEKLKQAGVELPNWPDSVEKVIMVKPDPNMEALAQQIGFQASQSRNSPNCLTFQQILQNGFAITEESQEYLTHDPERAVIVVDMFNEGNLYAAIVATLRAFLTDQSNSRFMMGTQTLHLRMAQNQELLDVISEIFTVITILRDHETPLRQMEREVKTLSLSLSSSTVPKPEDSIVAGLSPRDDPAAIVGRVNANLGRILREYGHREERDYLMRVVRLLQRARALVAADPQLGPNTPPATFVNAVAQALLTFLAVRRAHETYEQLGEEATNIAAGMSYVDGFGAGASYGPVATAVDTQTKVGQRGNSLLAEKKKLNFSVGAQASGGGSSLGGGAIGSYSKEKFFMNVCQIFDADSEAIRRSREQEKRNPTEKSALSKVDDHRKKAQVTVTELLLPFGELVAIMKSWGVVPTSVHLSVPQRDDLLRPSSPETVTEYRAGLYGKVELLSGLGVSVWGTAGRQTSEIWHQVMESFDRTFLPKAFLSAQLSAKQFGLPFSKVNAVMASFFSKDPNEREQQQNNPVYIANVIAIINGDVVRYLTHSNEYRLNNSKKAGAVKQSLEKRYQVVGQAEMIKIVALLCIQLRLLTVSPEVIRILRRVYTTLEDLTATLVLAKGKRTAVQKLAVKGSVKGVGAKITIWLPGIGSATVEASVDDVHGAPNPLDNGIKAEVSVDVVGKAQDMWQKLITKFSEKYKAMKSASKGKEDVNTMLGALSHIFSPNSPLKPFVGGDHSTCSITVVNAPTVYQSLPQQPLRPLPGRELEKNPSKNPWRIHSVAVTTYTPLEESSVMDRAKQMLTGALVGQTKVMRFLDLLSLVQHIQVQQSAGFFSAEKLPDDFCPLSASLFTPGSVGAYDLQRAYNVVRMYYNAAEIDPLIIELDRCDSALGREVNQQTVKRWWNALIALVSRYAEALTKMKDRAYQQGSL
ncbi:MAG: hypothetical protein LBG13_01050 [Holosporales bacterium]|nr:hypothetical protein [Holosporales bacterium]